MRTSKRILCTGAFAVGIAMATTLAVGQALRLTSGGDQLGGASGTSEPGHSSFSEPRDEVLVSARSPQFGGGGFGGALAEPRPEGMDDEKSLAVLEQLEKPVSLQFESDTPLADLVRFVATSTTSPSMPNGIAVYLDPLGLEEAGISDESPVKIRLEGVSLKRGLYLALRPLHLSYTVQDGLLIISTKDQLDRILFDSPVYQGKSPVEPEGIVQAGAFQ